MTTFCNLASFVSSALLSVSVTLAQQPTTQSQTPNQTPTMTPEDARDPQEMVPEDAVDTPAPRREMRGAVRGGEAAAQQDAERNAPSPDTAAQNAPASPSRQQEQPRREIDMLAATAPADCWAKLYHSENFAGGNVTLLGPAEVPQMQAEFRSVETGPGATLILFGEENFSDESGRFEPGRKAATPDQAPGLEGFASLRIICSTSGTG